MRRVRRGKLEGGSSGRRVVGSHPGRRLAELGVLVRGSFSVRVRGSFWVRVTARVRVRVGVQG